MPGELQPESTANQRSASRTSKTLAIAALAAMIIALALYTIWFAKTERTLYHADQVVYWSYSRGLADLMHRDPIAAVREVVRSVAEDDVNLMPALPISMVMLVFGGSRLTYLLAVVLIYGTATAAALLVALNRVQPRPPPWAAPLAFALLAPVWQPVFIGYVGLGGVALALIVLSLVLPARTTRVGARTLLGAGCLLGVLVLFRRWWGIWGIVLLAVLFLDALWRYLRSDDRSGEGIVGAFRAFVLVSLGSAFTVIALAAPVLVERLRTGYADRFSAYAHDTLAARWGSVVDHFGVLALLAVVLSILVLVRDVETRSLCVLLSIHVAVTFAIMVQIQDHTPQHWWLYSSQALLLLGMAAHRLGAEVSSTRARRSLGVWVVAGIVIVVSVFAPSSPVSRATLGPLVPADVVRPSVRHDLDEIDRMLTYLDRRIGPADRIYVLSSSSVLSDQVLAFSNLSLGSTHRSPSAVLNSSHVDRRDGFPRGLLVSDLVLVGDPIQLHLGPDAQRVVGEPAESFLSGTDIARAFVELPELFEISEGVKVRVFRRIRRNSSAEVADLSSRLRGFYPDRPFIYAPG